MAIPVLASSQYFPSGVYIGQLIQPAPSNPNVTRIPCYVGQGSRFAMARNQQIKRSYVVAEGPLVFPLIPPFTSPLVHHASNQKALASLVRSDGQVVKNNLWNFVFNSGTGFYDSIDVSPSVYDPLVTYKLNYQSVDRDVLDPLPVDDVREVTSLGLAPNSPDFTEFVDFFLTYTITEPLIGSSNFHQTSGFSPIVFAGTGLGAVTQDGASQFNHNYTRYYQVRCTSVSGAGPNRIATFAWQATPISDGEATSAPSPVFATTTIPTAPGVFTGYPQFTISESLAATLVQPLEHGVVLDFSYTGGGFAQNDLFTFNGMGPGLFELDGRLLNTNQRYQSGPVSAGVNNNTNVSVDFADANNPNNTYNALYELICTSASGSNASTTYTQAGNTIKFTSKLSGLVGNGIIIDFVSPTPTINQTLSVGFSGITLTINLATNGGGNVSSTFTQVINAINALSSSAVSAALTAGSGATVVVNAPVDPAVLSGGVDNTGTFAWAEHGNNVGVGGTFSYTQTSTALTNPAPTASLSNGVVVKLECTTSNFRPDAFATYAYTNGGGGLTFTARSPGVVGNLLTVALVNPGPSSTLSVTQSGNAITINLATDGGGIPTSTMTLIAAAVNAKGVSVTAVTTGVGATVAAASPATALSGGISADVFDFAVKAPRQFYQAKDSRNISLSVSTATNASAGVGLVSGSYVTNTPEGGFGVFSATANALAPSAPTYKNGFFSLPGNILLFARNLFSGPVSSAQGNQHVPADSHTFTATMTNSIDWSLTALSTETFVLGNILVDVTGLVTGAPSTRYVILANVPDSVTSVKSSTTGDALSYTIITSGSNNTQYLSFAVPPTSDVIVKYVYKAKEPDPGQFYFLTGKYIRPDEFFNTPILINSVENGRKLLDPPEVTNHLSIMNEIVMSDIGAQAMYIVQVKDLGGGGVFTDADFRAAITASEAPSSITDLVVLSHFGTLQDQLDSVTNMADPFKQRFRMTWIGAPIGTPIGDEDTPNSLVYLAQRTLQVFGNSNAHGTRVLVAPTLCTREVQIDINTTAEVTLDGSFVAGALAGLVGSFSDPGTDILRQNLTGFSAIQTYGEKASPDNLKLGGSNIIFFTNQGNGVFRIEEDVTVDSTAPDFNLINNMTQKMAVTKFVETEMDSKLIGIVVPSRAAGVSLVQGFLVQSLNSLVAKGIIARYQTDTGAERPIDASKDVRVESDATDPTLYHILYDYFLRNTIKRITGLFTVNSNNIGQGS